MNTDMRDFELMKEQLLDCLLNERHLESQRQIRAFLAFGEEAQCEYEAQRKLLALYREGIEEVKVPKDFFNEFPEKILRQYQVNVGVQG